MNDLCTQLRKFEEDRCEAVHSAINKFVVYEVSSQMNNKYDGNNFSKMLDEYKNEEELVSIEKVLFEKASKSNNHKFDFVEYESKKYNLSQIH